MLHLARKPGLILPLLLAGLVLRAFVPIGYMPAAAGSGLLFELCHEYAVLEIVARADDDIGHAHHHATEHEDAAHETSDDCAIGHMLFGAFVDSSAAPEFLPNPLTGIDVVHVTVRFLPVPRIGHPPRGPPSV